MPVSLKFTVYRLQGGGRSAPARLARQGALLAVWSDGEEWPRQENEHVPHNG